MRLHKATFIATFAALVTGCATQQDLVAGREYRVSQYLEKNDRPEIVAQALMANELVEGMTFRDVVAIWGPPRRVNRASYGSQAVWSQHCPNSRTLFQENIYVYFEGDIVTGWQRGDCIN